MKLKPPGCPESLDFAKFWQNLPLDLLLLQENSKQSKLESDENKFKTIKFFIKFFGKNYKAKLKILGLFRHFLRT